MTDTATLLFLVVSIVLVFVVLVLTAMAVRDAKKSPRDCQENCHKYSLWAAIVSGLTGVILIIALVMHSIAGRKGGKTTGAFGISPNIVAA